MGCECCRYEAGLQKLLAAEGEVNVMKEELIQLQPKLIATGKEVEETLIVVNSQTEAAEAQKAIVQAEEAAASEKAAAAKAIKVGDSQRRDASCFDAIQPIFAPPP